MNDLTVRKDAWVDVRGEIGLTGWQPPADLKVEEWSDVMRKAGAVSRAGDWIIGDCLVASDAKWGEMYEEAERLTGKTFDTLRRLRWIADSINVVYRSSNLSFTHHREIAKFHDTPDLQVYWLTEAERNGWSVRELHDAIAGGLAVLFPTLADLHILRNGYSII